MHFNNITSSLKDFTQPFVWQSMFLMPYGHVYSLFYTLNTMQWMTIAFTLLHVHHKHTFFVIDFPGDLWEGITSFWRIKKYNKWYFVFTLLHVHPNIHLLPCEGYECWDLSSQVQTKRHLSGESNNKYNVKQIIYLYCWILQVTPKIAILSQVNSKSNITTTNIARS